MESKLFKDNRIVLGVLLILAGLILALQQYGIIGGGWDDAFFAGIFVLGALFFANLYRQNRSQWWFGFLAVLLAALAIENLLDIFLPGLGNIIGGGVFLGLLGVAFFFVYFRDRRNWWAVIPGGVMLSLAAVSVFDNLPGNIGFETGGILFLGMGLTFLALYFMRVEGERLSWAIFPALALLAFGAFVGFGASTNWNYIWPIVLILFGLYFLFNSLRRR